MKENLNITLVALNSKYVHNNIAVYYLEESLNKNINIIKDINTNINLNTSILQLSVNEDFNNILKKIIDTRPDIVCIGVYIWNVNIVYNLCKLLKELLPDLIIALGGPEVSYNYNEILNNSPYIDSILALESELNIVYLVKDYLLNNKVVKKLYEIPIKSCDIPNISDKLVTECVNKPIYFETSRGCPYRCSYCTSCIDKTVRYRDLDVVFKELNILLEKNVKQIRFLDRTFNSNKDRAIKIWKYLISNRKDTTFHFEICANLIDNKTLEFLKTIPKDIFRFEIGVQSTNTNTLRAINRTNKFDLDKVVILKLVSFNNIFIHSDLIIGLPYETLRIFKKSFNDLYNLKTNEMQIGFLKFLKGTHIYYDKQKYGYIYNDIPPYEIISNKFITFDQIYFLKQFEEVFELLYNSNKFNQTIKYLENKFETPFNLYETITKFVIQNNIIKISYDIIYELLIKLFNNDTILIELLTYDYFTKFKGTRPWMYNKYDTKKEINEYIINVLNIPFSNHKEYYNIIKENKFLVLDYDIYTKQNKKTIYMIKK